MAKFRFEKKVGPRQWVLLREGEVPCGLEAVKASLPRLAQQEKATIRVVQNSIIVADAIYSPAVKFR